MIFQIFRIKKVIKEARENPSKFAGSELGDLLWGIVTIPIIIGVLGIILFFIIGYTHWFGFQFGFFKFLFWVALFVSLFIFFVIRKIIKSLRGQAVIHTKSIVKKLEIE